MHCSCPIFPSKGKAMPFFVPSGLMYYIIFTGLTRPPGRYRWWCTHVREPVGLSGRFLRARRRVRRHNRHSTYVCCACTRLRGPTTRAPSCSRRRKFATHTFTRYRLSYKSTGLNTLLNFLVLRSVHVLRTHGGTPRAKVLSLSRSSVAKRERHHKE